MVLAGIIKGKCLVLDDIIRIILYCFLWMVIFMSQCFTQSGIYTGMGDTFQQVPNVYNPLLHLNDTLLSGLMFNFTGGTSVQ